MTDKPLLMTPGPTFAPDRVLRALSKPLVHHREEEFTNLLKESYQMLKDLFMTQNDIFIITGSGTAAMDAAISNVLGPGDKALVVLSGKFSERMAEIVRANGAEPLIVDVPPGEAVDPKRVKEALEENEVKAVAMVHNNTSTGSVNPVKEVGQIVKDYDAVLITDFISSMGGDYINVDEFKVDLAFTGSQKCLALPPGLAFISVSEKAWKLIERNENRPFYLDLLKYKKAWPQTPFTVAISMIYALNEALKAVFEEGLENRVKRHELLRRMTRAGVKALGLKPFVRDEISSKTVTSVLIPDFQVPEAFSRYPQRKARDRAFRGTMRKYGVLVAKGQSWVNGKGEKVNLEGVIFRIGHMGAVTPREVLTAMAALELTLKELKVPVEGSGVEAAEEVLLHG